MLPNTNAVNFCDIDFRHRAVLPTCLKNRHENPKSGHDNIILDKIPKYFRPQHKLFNMMGLHFKVHIWITCVFLKQRLLAMLHSVKKKQGT